MAATPKWVWWVGGAGLVWLFIRWLVPPPGIVGALVAYAANIPPGGRFGVRRKGGKVHKGVDIFAPEGTPVVAAADGVVDYSGRISGYGETITLAHDGGLRTLYAHLSRRYAARGASVSRGDTIGLVGRTADGECGRYFCADPPHLHFEVITDSGPINPSRDRVEPVAWLADQGLAPYA